MREKSTNLFYTQCLVSKETKRPSCSWSIHEITCRVFPLPCTPTAAIKVWLGSKVIAVYLCCWVSTRDDKSPLKLLTDKVKANYTFLKTDTVVSGHPASWDVHSKVCYSQESEARGPKAARWQLLQNLYLPPVMKEAKLWKSSFISGIFRASWILIEKHL